MHDQVGDIHDGGQGLRHVVDERHDLARVSRPTSHLDAAHPQDGAHAQVYHQKRDGIKNRREARRPRWRYAPGHRLPGQNAHALVIRAQRLGPRGRLKALATDECDAIELCLQLLVEWMQAP